MNAPIETARWNCRHDPAGFVADAIADLDAGEPNTWSTYFVGHLAASRFPAREHKRLDSLASALYASAELNQVALVQHRVADDLYEYRAKKLCARSMGSGAC